MRKLLLGSSALVLVAGGAVLPRALAGTSSSTEPPTCGSDISLSISPQVLWPPNHKMIPIQLVAKDTDGSDSGEMDSVMIGTITNNDEIGNGPAEINGTGQPDVAAGDQTQPNPATQTFGDGGSVTFNFSLAAERSGHDTTSGRTYTIPVTCSESPETMMPNTVDMTVVVPHDQSGK